MARRNIWDDDVNEQRDGDHQDTAFQRGPLDGATTSPQRPQTMLSQLRTASARPKAKRNRTWERKNISTTYRLVPNELRDAVKAVAHDLGYTADQIAQVFLAYGWDSYKNDELRLTAKPGLYKQQVSYRLSGEIREAIHQVARDHKVPKGEVVSAFLQYAHDAYQTGILALVDES